MSSKNNNKYSSKLIKDNIPQGMLFFFIEIYYGFKYGVEYMKTTIIGVILKNRLEDAIEFQKIITNYGCDIKTRVGLHPVQKDTCVNSGIVLLEVLKNAEKLIKELKEKWDIKTMEFEL